MPFTGQLGIDNAQLGYFVLGAGEVVPLTSGLEKFSTLAVTTLNGAIDAVQTTLTVDSAANFPLTGTFSLMIGTEIMKVTGVAGTTFTVVRGHEGTTAAVHSDGDTVVGAITRRTFEAIRSEFVTTGLAADFAQARSGRMYLPNDAGNVRFDDGSALVKTGRGIDRLYPPPAGFSWINQGISTIDASLGFFKIASAAKVGDSVSIYKKTLPATPYSVLVNFDASGVFANFTQVGLVLRESATGKLRTFGVETNAAGGGFGAANWTNPTTFLAAAFSYAVSNHLASGNQIRWLKIRLDGTNVILSFGTRRNNVQVIDTRLKNYHFTTAPDEIGVYVNVNNASFGLIGNFYSWEEGV